MSNPSKKPTDTPASSLKLGDVCHIDIPVKDTARARRFYGEVFGWSFQEIPEMNYTLFSTPGGSVGGGLAAPSEMTPDKVVNYMLVESIEATVKRVEEHGGKPLSPKVEVPGHGWLMQILDSEGNLIALWQAK